MVVWEMDRTGGSCGRETFSTMVAEKEMDLYADSACLVPAAQRDVRWFVGLAYQLSETLEFLKRVHCSCTG